LLFSPQQLARGEGVVAKPEGGRPLGAVRRRQVFDAIDGLAARDALESTDVLDVRPGQGGLRSPRDALA
jgi:hypothetical protein